MQNALLNKYINKNRRTDLKEFRNGDTIRVHVKIKEGDKERLQAYEGVVIARNNSGMGETITVRKISFGQGVERIFPLHGTADRSHRSGAHRQGAPLQTVLSARTQRQGRPSQGTHLSAVWRVPNRCRPNCRRFEAQNEIVEMSGNPRRGTAFPGISLYRRRR